MHTPAREELLHRVHPETKLPTRACFDERIDLEYRHAKRYNEKLSLLVVDIDRLEDLVAATGLTSAAPIVGEVGQRIQRTIRDVDFVGHLTDTRLAVILPNTRASDAMIVGDKLRRAVAQDPVTIGDTTLLVTLSIGMAQYPGLRAHDLSSLIESAEQACELVREAGGDSVNELPLH